MQRSPALVALQRTQWQRRTTLTLIALLMVALFAFVGSWPASGAMHGTIENTGRLAIILCILGRSWCTLYIGGHKARSLVESGPYSISRNPLYVFSIIGAWGFGAQSGSLSVGLVCALVVWAVFRTTVNREERFLSESLGAPYLAYKAVTPRFWPNVSRWNAPETIEIKPRLVVRTLLDGLLFLTAIPLAEGLEYLQERGAISLLWRLP